MKFRNESVRSRFHELEPFVQIELQGVSEEFFKRGKELQILFVDKWGMEKDDYEISLKISPLENASRVND